MKSRYTSGELLYLKHLLKGACARSSSTSPPSEPAKSYIVNTAESEQGICPKYTASPPSQNLFGRQQTKTSQNWQFLLSASSLWVEALNVFWSEFSRHEVTSVRPKMWSMIPLQKLICNLINNVFIKMQGKKNLLTFFCTNIQLFNPPTHP